ncbi:S-adenosyl-L-methionine-dependent methyltransferase [Phyllosticta capitalensis]
MTHLSLNATFDASLIDLSAHTFRGSESFSTIDTETSDADAAIDQSSTPSRVPLSTKDPSAARPMPAPSKSVRNEPHVPIRYMDTTSAYDAWACVYDTDGNILQAIDDMEMETLLPRFLDLVCSRAVGHVENEPLRIVDLGCGTGRNTVKLLTTPWDKGVSSVDIVGMDASAKMLEEARRKLSAVTQTQAATRVDLTLVQHDILHPNDPSSSPHALPCAAHAVISTLVVEHLPLPDFFQALSRLLLPGGYALVTNMHPEMGAKAQAGFLSTDEQGRKIKVRGKSWTHGIEELICAAQREGLGIVGEVVERAVGEHMVRDGRVSERGRKWIGSEVWFGVVLQKRR